MVETSKSIKVRYEILWGVIDMKMKRIPRRLWKKLTKTKIYNYLPDKWAVSIKYRNHFYRKLDLKNPKTFNEKLQWLKLYDRRPEYTRMVDKYLAKEYVASIIGEEYIIPTLGVWKSFDEIDFDALPDQFVLKCNHGSGDAVICKDKKTLDVAAARKKLTAALEQDYYLVSREWPYKNVDRVILAEQYIEDSVTHDARDYKLFCFNGEVKSFVVDVDRFISHRSIWYERDRRILPFTYKAYPSCTERNIELPKDLDQMIYLAEKLAQSIPFLRVDFYYVNERIYVGELTFYPGSGLLPFTDEEGDILLGQWLNLPEIIK
jgi:hypothetical protein